MALRPALERFLDAGGRWFFNGHVMRPLLDGLMPYQAMTEPKRSEISRSLPAIRIRSSPASMSRRWRPTGAWRVSMGGAAIHRRPGPS